MKVQSLEEKVGTGKAPKIVKTIKNNKHRRCWNNGLNNPFLEQPKSLGDEGNGREEQQYLFIQQTLTEHLLCTRHY